MTTVAGCVLLIASIAAATLAWGIVRADRAKVGPATRERTDAAAREDGQP